MSFLVTLNTHKLIDHDHVGDDCDHGHHHDSCQHLEMRNSIFTLAELGQLEKLKSTLAQKQIEPLSSGARLWFSKFDFYGYSCLHYAAQSNRKEVVMYLLKQRVAVDGNKCGATPLHRAAYAGHVDICKLLLEAKANVNAQDQSFEDRRTPLHKAASQNHLELVQIFIDAGANVSLVDAHQYQAIELTEHHAIQNLLRQHGAQVCPESSHNSTRLKPTAPTKKSVLETTDDVRPSTMMYGFQCTRCKSNNNLTAECLGCCQKIICERCCAKTSSRSCQECQDSKRHLVFSACSRSLSSTTHDVTIVPTSEQRGKQEKRTVSGLFDLRRRLLNQHYQNLS